jgi:hypothetical protein
METGFAVLMIVILCVVVKSMWMIFSPMGDVLSRALNDEQKIKLISAADAAAAAAAAAAAFRVGGNTSNALADSINKLFKDSEILSQKLGYKLTRSLRPSFAEKFFSGLLCFFSIALYVTFVILQYFGKNTVPLKACINTSDLSRYVNIYAEPYTLTPYTPTPTIQNVPV